MGTPRRGGYDAQPVNISVASNSSFPETLTLTSNNPAEDDIWINEDTLPVCVIGPDSQDPSAISYTFRGVPSPPSPFIPADEFLTLGGQWISSFAITATKGDTTPDVTQLTLTRTDPHAAVYTDIAGASFFSNAVSNASITFKTALDAYNNPILPLDNSQAVADAASSPGGENPPVQLTEIDIVYPMNDPSAPLSVTLGAFGQANMRLWDAPDGGNLIAGATYQTVTFTNNPPATLYAEATGINPSLYFSSPYYGLYDRITPDLLGLSTTDFAPNVLGLSTTDFAPGDPHATIPIDTPSAGETPTPSDFALVNLTVPEWLPVGAQVTLSIDPSVAQNVDIYNSDPAFDPSAEAIIGKDAGGVTSYTWTLGSDRSSQTFAHEISQVYANEVETRAGGTGSTSLGSWESSFFTLQVQLPSSGSAGSSSFHTNFAPAPASQPTTVATTQPAAGGQPGHLIAFDGSNDTPQQNTIIYQFTQVYDGIGPYTYEKGPSTASVGRVAHYVDLAAFGLPEMQKRVTDAEKAIVDFYKTNDVTKVPLDLVGYSRGAIEVDMMMNDIFNKHLVDVRDPATGQLVPFYRIGTVRFIGLISPVAWIKNAAQDFPVYGLTVPMATQYKSAVEYMADKFDVVDVAVNQRDLLDGQNVFHMPNLDHITIAENTKQAPNPVFGMMIQAAKKAGVLFKPET